MALARKGQEDVLSRALVHADSSAPGDAGRERGGLGQKCSVSLQIHFKQANREQGREQRDCQSSTPWGTLEGEGGGWRESPRGLAAPLPPGSHLSVARTRHLCPRGSSPKAHFLSTYSALGTFPVPSEFLAIRS